MNISKRKWLIMLIYLVVACIVVVILGAIIAKIVICTFYMIFYGLPFGLSKVDVLLCIKGGFYGGSVSGIGCWFRYYYYYNSHK
ncbi:MULTISPECIES: hypothetical protein [Photorhabdus]|uniref:Uncharacterized protein n=1 Tax=Photorhabdus asymbiotica TaxID=291112 RepID=A0ABX9SSQ2_9GAMM|nr:hypothetical protein [Photorhabdus asymbiotica]RKS66490.1 hypothetical protein BDD30_0795 [Photorhabdus asymbiotica]